MLEIVSVSEPEPVTVAAQSKSPTATVSLLVVSSNAPVVEAAKVTLIAPSAALSRDFSVVLVARAAVT